MKQSTCNFQSKLAISANLRVLMLVVLFICPHFIIGQITVPSTTFPAAGDKLRYKQASNPNAAVSLFTLSPDGSVENTDVTTVKGFTVVQTYPNPAKAVLTIQLENITEGIAQFEIMDITGKVVKIENKLLTEGYNEVTLDIQNLSTGLHFIKVKDSGNNEAVVKMSKM